MAAIIICYKYSKISENTRRDENISSPEPIPVNWSEKFCAETAQEPPPAWTVTGPTGAVLPDRGKPHHPGNLGRAVTSTHVHPQSLSRSRATTTNTHDQAIC